MLLVNNPLFKFLELGQGEHLKDVRVRLVVKKYLAQSFPTCEERGFFHLQIRTLQLRINIAAYRKGCFT